LGRKSTPKFAWRPILNGSLREQAVAAVESIAADLRRFSVRDFSLAGGAAGISLMFDYFARYRSVPGDQNISQRFLDQAIESVSDEPSLPSLYSGFTGVAWVCEHLHSGVSNTVVDRVLLRYLKATPWKDDYDLVSGLVGIGIYALERLPGKSAVESLNLVLRRLEELAEVTPNGITWHTDPRLLPGWQRERCPNGYYNLGLAHGIPGVIGILALIYAAGIQRKTARKLLAGAIQWLLGHQLPSSFHSRFSSWLGPGLPHDPTRLAWCYGDLGIASSLLIASLCLRNKSWKRSAMRIACHAARRSQKNSGVKDAGLCHGAAGVGHIFNRMFQVTGNSTLRKSARFWFQQTLEMRQPGKGVGGFCAFSPGGARGKSWVKDPDLLTGSAGIALALIAAVSSMPPDWDRCLLLSAKKSW
jgi:lantibiotic modifying enzyme